VKSDEENQDGGQGGTREAHGEGETNGEAAGAGRRQKGETRGETGDDRDGDGEPASPEDRMAAVAAERDELKDRLLRVAADFENFKKRNRAAEAQADVRGREAVLKDMLEVMDNLERAVSAYGEGTNGAVDGPAILKGVGLVLRLFKSKLDRHDVKPVAAEGQPFDPRRHEAISRVEREDLPPGTVAVELQRGYTIGDRLLRPALVSVAAQPSTAGPSRDAKGEGA
jgi:molecular chaperone GrpE